MHHAPEALVSAVEIIDIDVGTTTRVQLKVEHNGPASLPRQWFIKMPSLAWRARAITALPRLLKTEVHFYQRIVSSLPVITAPVLAAASQFRHGSTLVFANVAETGALPGQSGQALSLSQAQAVVKQLALFHAQFWNKTHLNPDFNLLAGPTRRLEDALGTWLAVPLMRSGLNKAATEIPLPIQTGAIAYARQRRKVMALLNQGPQTLIHGDCHPGNFFWQDDQPGFLDWQLVRIGEGLADVAYFLATALEPALRREQETRLLSLYCDTLISQGITTINFETAWQRYRMHLCYPFEAMVVTLAIGGMMRLDSNMIMLHRAATAIADHQVFNLLGITTEA